MPWDCVTRDLTLVRIMGGLLASAYLRTVFLWMPNSCVKGVDVQRLCPPKPESTEGHRWTA